MRDSEWFKCKQVDDNIWRIVEPYCDGSCNSWLVKGAAHNYLIDCGMGLCNMNTYLKDVGLLKADEDCIVLCTHIHYDHTGGAQHFEDIRIHNSEQEALNNGDSRLILNYLNDSALRYPPQSGYRARDYRVPPTVCEGLIDGQVLELGAGDQLEVMHLPGHTQGSIAVLYPQRGCVFSGDVVYDCGNGSDLFDFLPSSSLLGYRESAEKLCRILNSPSLHTVYPGHNRILNSARTTQLLTQYLDHTNSCFRRFTNRCMTSIAGCYLKNRCLWC